MVFGHPGRGIAKGNLVTLAMVVITGLALLLTMLLAAVGATAEGLVRRIAAPGGRHHVRRPHRLLALARCCPSPSRWPSSTSCTASPPPPGSRAATPRWGALLATLLWEGAKAGFAWYLRNLARYAGLYGALEGVIVLAIWVELSVSIVLYGAEVVALMGPRTIDNRAGRE